MRRHQHLGGHTTVAKSEIQQRAIGTKCEVHSLRKGKGNDFIGERELRSWERSTQESARGTHQAIPDSTVRCSTVHWFFGYSGQTICGHAAGALAD